MHNTPHDALKNMLEAKRWTEALAKVDERLASHPCAAQLHLLRGQLLQLQSENTAYTLDDVALACQNALALDDTYFDALVELWWRPRKRGGVTVSIKTRATIEDLYKVEGKAELV